MTKKDWKLVLLFLVTTFCVSSLTGESNELIDGTEEPETESPPPPTDPPPVVSSVPTEPQKETKKPEPLTFYSITNQSLPGIRHYSEYWEKFEAPYNILKSYPYYHSGYDDDNRPIWVIELGKWDFRKSVSAGGEIFRNFDKHTAQTIYRIIRSLHEVSTEDNPVDGITMIIDLDQLGLEQVTHVPTLSFVAGWIRRYFSELDENLYFGCVVNTNALAQGVLNFLRPVLGKLFERVEVYGTNKAKFAPHLLKKCPKESLPEWYGGSKKFQPLKVYG